MDSNALDKLVTQGNRQSITTSQLARAVRRADEDRWLSARFAPQPLRHRLELVLALWHEFELSRTASGEAMINAIRLAWWREQVEALASGSGPKSDCPPLIAALHEKFREAPETLLPLLHVIDCHQDMMEGRANRIRLHAAELTALLKVSGCTPDAIAVSAWAEMWVSRHSVQLAEYRALSRQTGKIPGDVWPLVGYLSLIPLYAVRNQSDTAGALSKRWRLVRMALGGQI